MAAYRTVGSGTVLRQRYRLAGPMRAGAMGQVWRAEDVHLGRTVAVKTLTSVLLAGAEGDRHRAVRRFEREARAAARLDHPNIAAVYDAGEEDGVCFLVMPLIDGMTLGEFHDEQGDREQLAVDCAAAVAAQLCAGLAAAHAAALVHRDLKPANVMVRADGTVVILDFGLVKVLGESGASLTATAEGIGNQLYASPELLGSGHPVDGRSDLYALGCLLHHLLAGVPLFLEDGRDALVAGRHLYEDPVPLDALRDDLPPDVVALVLALLAKDPADRPADSRTVYAVLARHLPAALVGPAGREEYADPRRPFRYPAAPYPAGPNR